MPVNILLKNVRRFSRETDERVDVRIGRGRIREIGRGLAPHRSDRVLTATNYLVLPGLINGHDHLSLNVYPRLGTPPYENFYEWAREVYRPGESPQRDVERISLRDRLWWGAYKNLTSGVTTVVHHDPFAWRVFRRSYPVRVLRRYAWSHSLGYGGDCARAFRRGRPFIIHAAEGVDRRAEREIAELDAMGLLASNTVLIHAVALRRPQIERIAETKTAVVWCPASNLYLYKRTAPVSALLQRGVRVVIGTDSTMSGAPSLFDEMRAARATGMVATDALLDMVTTVPAALFGMMDGRGGITEGGRADLLLMPDRGRTPAESVLEATETSPALVLVRGEPRLAGQEAAQELELGDARVLVGGQPRWLYGNLPGLAERIAAHVPPNVLERNPLWCLLRDIPQMPDGLRGTSIQTSTNAVGQAFRPAQVQISAERSTRWQSPWRSSPRRWAYPRDEQSNDDAP